MRVLFLIPILLVLLYCQGGQTPDLDCRRLDGVPGPEDFYWDEVSKELFVSSHNRRQMESLGGIAKVLWSAETGFGKLEWIGKPYPPDFRPHGISYTTILGIPTLFVISHSNREGALHTIEVFEKSKNGIWKHKETITDPLLTSPNDIFATESGEIWISNDRGTGGSFRANWDILIGHARADIVYYSNGKFQKLGEEVVLGNGIHVQKTKDGQVLLRAVYGEKRVKVYKIQKKQDGTVHLDYWKSIAVDGGPDNLLEDTKGHLWLAVHPSTFGFVLHASGLKSSSPSKVYWIDNSTYEPKLFLETDGKPIGALSTALGTGKRLLLSQVFEDFVLDCKGEGLIWP